MIPEWYLEQDKKGVTKIIVNADSKHPVIVLRDKEFKLWNVYTLDLPIKLTELAKDIMTFATGEDKE